MARHTLTTSRRHADSRRGFTAVELLIALAITGVVGLGIASMLTAVGNGSADANDLRSLVARHKILTARLDDAVVGSRRILAHGGNYLVLWIHDDRANNQPNLSELQRIEHDSATGEVRSYAAAFPAGWTVVQREAADTAYTLGDDFAAVTQSLKSGNYFPVAKWASGVSGFTTSLNAASAQAATLVSYRLSLTAGSHTDTCVGAAALRP